MILIIRRKATEEEIGKMSVDISGYIKVVVDIEKNILAGGGKRHVDAEQILLAYGSKQENLWGGGFDLDTKQVDYNSMINVRPRLQNFSRDIMSGEIRKKFDRILKLLV